MQLGQLEKNEIEIRESIESLNQEIMSIITKDELDETEYRVKVAN
jgi:hypothetical protein